ncbi:MAG: hypothetical protein IPM45_00660 [Acidimicrobiales bacterium]|nr:hypothetical protein [Acidimicrobiales bacterium]
MAPHLSAPRRGLALLFAGTLAVGGLAACGDDDDAGGGSVEEYCALAVQLDDIGQQAGTASDPAEFERLVNEQYDLAQQAAEVAPEEIQADVQTLTDALGQVVDIGDATDWDIAAMSEDSDFLAISQDEAVTEAGDRVTAYDEQNCGLPSDGGSTDTTGG